MSKILGFDIGATKSRGVLIDQEKGVIKTVFGGAASLSATELEQAAKNFEKVVSDLLSDVDDKILSVGIGSAAYVEPAEELLKNFYGEILSEYGINSDKVFVFSDVLSAHISVFLFKPGVVVIAGTGSITFGFYNDKQVVVGGAGHLIGDEGSAFFVGQRGINAVVRALDGRGEETSLVKRVFEYFSTEDPQEVLVSIYTAGSPKEVIAGFAKIVAEEARKGDKVANKIFRDAARELAISIVAALKRLGKMDLPIGIVGGLWDGAKDLLEPMLKDELRNLIGRDVNFEEAKIKPDCAAALEGARRANILNENLISVVLKTCQR